MQMRKYGTWEKKNAVGPNTTSIRTRNTNYTTSLVTNECIVEEDT
jgi:hypothetical protein